MGGHTKAEHSILCWLNWVYTTEYLSRLLNQLIYTIEYLLYWVLTQLTPWVLTPLALYYRIPKILDFDSSGFILQNTYNTGPWINWVYTTNIYNTGPWNNWVYTKEYLQYWALTQLGWSYKIPTILGPDSTGFVTTKYLQYWALAQLG
jgi:hypothetical protein